ncbi:MAG: TIGR03619 family F420-dependent LLM class oxidoreductase [Halieaceae bacterium]|jgi:probable F420-dependent oxidoreductase|nr:TIGR03619 family F420-dependent LLM class oxidoreductase [Halieaceae bacterium]
MKFGLSIAFTEPSDYCDLAKVAQESGFWAITLPDHLIYPAELSVPYPYTEDGTPRFAETDPFPDPWISIVAMSQVASRLHYYTNVYVLPARNPFHVAKILSTVSHFTDGRMGLGIGVGWMPEEFEVSDMDFKKRGKRTDEMIEVMKKLWTGERVEHHGEFYDFAPLRMAPKPKKPIPIYVGGFSAPALKRAANNDGWIADLHTLAELEALLEKLSDYRREAGTLDRDFEILSFGCIDAMTLGGYHKMGDMGVTVTTTMPWAIYGHSPAAPLQVKIDSIKRFGDEVISKM